MRSISFEWNPRNWLFGRAIVKEAGTYITTFWLGFGPLIWLYRTEGY